MSNVMPYTCHQTTGSQQGVRQRNEGSRSCGRCWWSSGPPSARVSLATPPKPWSLAHLVHVESHHGEEADEGEEEELAAEPDQDAIPEQRETRTGASKRRRSASGERQGSKQQQRTRHG